MATINANMTAEQDYVPLALDDIRFLEPGFYSLGAEDLEITGALTLDVRGRAIGRRAMRGIGGSTPATHSSGGTLTRYYPEAPSDSGATVPTLAAVLDEGNDADGKRIRGLTSPLDDDEAATKGYVDESIAGIPAPSTPALAAVLDTGNDADGQPIVGLATPTAADHAATKGYVDGGFARITRAAGDPNTEAQDAVFALGAAWFASEGPFYGGVYLDLVDDSDPLDAPFPVGFSSTRQQIQDAIDAVNPLAGTIVVTGTDFATGDIVLTFGGARGGKAVKMAVTSTNLGWASAGGWTPNHAYSEGDTVVPPNGGNGIWWTALFTGQSGPIPGPDWPIDGSDAIDANGNWENTAYGTPGLNIDPTGTIAGVPIFDPAGVSPGLGHNPPVSGALGDLYVDTDTGDLYVDTDTGWVQIAGPIS